MTFELWKSENGRWHYRFLDDHGKLVHAQFARRLDCNMAIARQRKLYPDAKIVVLKEPPT